MAKQLFAGVSHSLTHTARGVRLLVASVVVVIIGGLPPSDASAQHGSNEPIIGTWHLDTVQSTWLPNQVPSKVQTETYRHIDGHRIEMTARRTRVDGSSRYARYSFPAEGGMMRVEQGEGFDPKDSFLTVRLSAYEWISVYLTDGRQTETRYKVISKDGMTIRHTLRTVDKQGNPVESVQVFQKR